MKFKARIETYLNEQCLQKQAFRTIDLQLVWSIVSSLTEFESFQPLCGTDTPDEQCKLAVYTPNKLNKLLHRGS